MLIEKTGLLSNFAIWIAYTYDTDCIYTHTNSIHCFLVKSSDSCILSHQTYSKLRLTIPAIFVKVAVVCNNHLHHRFIVLNKYAQNISPTPKWCYTRIVHALPFTISIKMSCIMLHFVLITTILTTIKEKTLLSHSMFNRKVQCHCIFLNTIIILFEKHTEYRKFCVFLITVHRIWS